MKTVNIILIAAGTLAISAIITYGLVYTNWFILWWAFIFSLGALAG